MDREQFWYLIDETRPVGGDSDDHALALIERLSGMETSEIVSFETHFLGLMAELDRESVSVINRMVFPLQSDDGFEDFRGWVILQGKQCLEDLLSASENVIRHFPKGVYPWCELALVTAMNAYHRKTGSWEMPIDYQSLPDPINEPPLSDEEIRKRFPELWRRFITKEEKEE